MIGYDSYADYIRALKQKYKEAYTDEEIQLNQQLSDECSKEKIDINAIESLLKQGADPLGGTEIFGWGDHIYGEYVADSQDTNSIYLPEITELFLKYGMNIDAPRVPYDDEDSQNPLWDFTFATNENSIIALKILLEHGLSAASFDEFCDHSIFDLVNDCCGDPQNDPFWHNECVWTFKMMLLGASYDHILEVDEYLRKFIGCSYNLGDVHMFRDWDNFEYYFDTSHCEKLPELYGSIIHIYSKETGKEVWKIDMRADGEESKVE